MYNYFTEIQCKFVLFMSVVKVWNGLYIIIHSRTTCVGSRRFPTTSTATRRSSSSSETSRTFSPRTRCGASARQSNPAAQTTDQSDPGLNSGNISPEESQPNLNKLYVLLYRMRGFSLFFNVVLAFWFFLFSTDFKDNNKPYIFLYVHMYNRPII